MCRRWATPRPIRHQSGKRSWVAHRCSQTKTPRFSALLTVRDVSIDRETHLGVIVFIVFENAYARLPLPRDIFNGPYDVRFGLDGNDFACVFWGPALAEVGKQRCCSYQLREISVAYMLPVNPNFLSSVVRPRPDSSHRESPNPLRIIKKPSVLEKLVRSSGFEPPRYCYRQPLKLVRLPVPPRPQFTTLATKYSRSRYLLGAGFCAGCCAGAGGCDG